MTTLAVLEIDSITVGSVTTVEVAFRDAPHLRGKGLATQAPEDKRNKQVGFDLALARALENLGNKYNRQGWGQIKFEEKRAAAAKRKAKKAKKAKAKVRVSEAT
jgi:hypothetical protein